MGTPMVRVICGTGNEPLVLFGTLMTYRMD
jgi:hypothetical protein